MDQTALKERVSGIASEAGFDAVGVAFYDYENGQTFTHEGDRFFHAASTIKVAILLAIYKLAEEGRLRLDDTLHVRNRFYSLIAGEIFRVSSGRDADNEVHRRLGRSMRIRQLARAMIVRSSNLATNLLLDFAGLATVQDMIRQMKIEGVEMTRGVEDTRAFEAGLNNRVTALGLARLFRLLCEGDFFREDTRQQILEVLHAQEFNSMIPKGLPEGAQVAHKTGEISTACHDAGIVSLPDRKPYILAILTEMKSSAEGRHETVARISRAVYDFMKEP